MVCFRNAPFSLNRLPQMLHANGFSPVWTRMWFSRYHRERNSLPQIWQPCKFPTAEIQKKGVVRPNMLLASRSHVYLATIDETCYIVGLNARVERKNKFGRGLSISFIS